MNVTFRQLRLFLALAETGSVSAAAKVMHVTQPTASMQLKEMSLSVGLALYEVIGKKIYLTDVGKELAATARAMTAAWEAFEQGVDATKGLSKGKLRVSVVSTAKYFMPMLLVRFGMVTLEQLKSFRGYFVVVAFVVAAIVTPPDVISQLALAIPMCLLYEVGMLGARWFDRNTRTTDKEEAAEA